MPIKFSMKKKLYKNYYDLHNTLLDTPLPPISEVLRVDWRNSTPSFLLLPRPENTNKLFHWVGNEPSLWQSSSAATPPLQEPQFFKHKI